MEIRAGPLRTFLFWPNRRSSSSCASHSRHRNFPPMDTGIPTSGIREALSFPAPPTTPIRTPLLSSFHFPHHLAFSVLIATAPPSSSSCQERSTVGLVALPHYPCRASPAPHPLPCYSFADSPPRRRPPHLAGAATSPEFFLYVNHGEIHEIPYCSFF